MATPGSSKPLRVNDLLFINAYMAGGRNGTKAYQAAHPKCSYQSARKCASELLAKPHIQAELASRVVYDAGITREYVESSLLRYQRMADEQQDYIAGASICMDAAKVAGLITEKKEVRSVGEGEVSAIASLVSRSMRPSLRMTNTDGDALPLAPVTATVTPSAATVNEASASKCTQDTKSAPSASGNEGATPPPRDDGYHF